MMKVIETKDVEGLASLLGANVMLMCMNYNYYGKLVGVNDTCVKLEHVSIIYETGKWDANFWKDAQSLHVDVTYVQTCSIESFFQVDK